MYELFGIVSFSKSNFHQITSPFNNLEIFKSFNFEEVELLSKYSKFFIGSDKTKPEIYSNEIIQIIIYGKCYLPLDSSSAYNNSSLTARDVWILYAEKGKKNVTELKGSYVIIINDQKINNIFIFSDPLNVKNIYYLQYEKQFIFSSSLTALCHYLVANGFKTEVDEQSVIEQLLFNIILENRTLINNISEIPPGTEISISRDKIEQNVFFDAFENISISGFKLNEKDSVEQLKSLFIKNIELYTEGPENTAIALTGGYDSRTIVSLLGERRNHYEYFSYGLKHSWDITIPQKIAKNLNLDYKSIIFNNNFFETFIENGKTAVLLGDGMGEISQANIVYVYSNFFETKTSILTGLFGSELIKNPTSMGYFINRNVYKLLFAENIIESFDLIGKNAVEERIISFELFDRYKEKIYKAINSNRYLTNDLPKNKKLFYYLLMVGMRKYFMKEIKIQKNWVTNLHPFFDIDFIQKLMETPFPWVYNWSPKKNIIKNLSIHKLYALLINTNPILANTISTHGFRPKYLLNKVYMPLLAIEYITSKKQIKKQSTLNIDYLIENEKQRRLQEYKQSESPFLKPFFDNRMLNTRAISKIISLQMWFESVGLSL